VTKKVNLFRDKEYEDLDWLNKAVESFVCPLNDKMAQFPDVYEFNYNDILVLHKDTIYDINSSDMIRYIAAQCSIDINYEEINMLLPYFEVTMGGRGPAELDFEAGTLSHTIPFFKKKPQLEDEDILLLMAQQAYAQIRRINYNANIGRLNEIMDLIGCTTDRKSRSVSYKIQAISSCFRDIITTDKWRLRNVDLAVSAAAWMVSYANDGNLSALSSFTRLKCMTHNNAPIYSMEKL
jgi:hypothetical protein